MTDAALAGLLCLVLGTSSPAALSQDVTRRVTRDVDYLAPSGTLSDVIARAELILLGTVDDTTQRVVGQGLEAWPTLEHRVRVVRKLKGPATVAEGATVLVSRLGGVAVSAGIEMRVRDPESPVLARGDRVVLFLHRDPYFGTYASVHGPATIFKVNGSQVVVPRAARRWPSLTASGALALDDFLADIAARCGSGCTRGVGTAAPQDVPSAPPYDVSQLARGSVATVVAVSGRTAP